MSKNMQHGKEWEAAIARSLPDHAMYTRIPDSGPAARAASQAGVAIRFAAARPYDARIDWWPGYSAAIECKSAAGKSYAAPAKTRVQISAMANFSLTTGIPALLLLELRELPESDRWWWISAGAVEALFIANERHTLRLADLDQHGHRIDRAPRGRTKLYLELDSVLTLWRVMR